MRVCKEFFEKILRISFDEQRLLVYDGDNSLCIGVNRLRGGGKATL